MIRLEQVNLQRSGNYLLESVSLTLKPGYKIGLVGANGCGKSTLLALIRGELQPDRGDVVVSRGQRIAHMAQEVEHLERSAIDFVLDGDTELRRIQNELAAAEASGDHNLSATLHTRLADHDGYTAESRAARLLNGLGFKQEQLGLPTRSFSGGWRMRLNLAKALMMPSDILLLDEPTNHLDLDAILWLQQWLKQYPGTLVVISHDRDFMDDVIDHTIHIEHRQAFLYSGNYSAFERQRAERLALQQSAYEKQQRQRAHLEQFIRRFKAKATKAKQAQSRVKALSKLEDLAPAHIDSPFNFTIPEADKTSSPLMHLEKAGVGYGDVSILHNITLNIQPGDRIALLGPNGAGKSTLIRALAGETRLISGKRVDGEHLSIGYFAQHQLETLDSNASPMLHLQRLSPDAREQTLRDFLGGFDFHGDQATDSIASFSGGEKARLALALIAWQKPNLLLLDEPTNHLDLEMRLALTLALQSFEGAMILVSHDRHLIRSTVDSLYLVHNGRMDEFTGDLDEYSSWLEEQRREQRKQETVEAEPAAKLDSAADRKARKQKEAEIRRKLSPLKRNADKLEQQLEKVQEKLASVEEALSSSDIYQDENKDKLKALLADQTELKRQEEETEESWMEAMEAYEELKAELE
ncbi:ATP-binding cassette domain-containing protein [Spongorhabdus nitratireducens]